MRTHAYGKRILAVMILVCASVAALAAWPPPFLNYQGVLRDSQDNPLDGTYDMVFRFYGAAEEEILIDRHTAAAGGAIIVSDGLFTVSLGGGVVEDGNGPGTYTVLWDVFRDHQIVNLEVQIGADDDPDKEVLFPPTRIHAAAYAMNASSLAGLEVSSLLRSDASDAYTSGTLTFTGVTVLDVNGTLNMDGAVTKATTNHVANFNADLLDGNDSTAFSRLDLNNTFSGANFFTRIPVNNSLYGGPIAIAPATATANYTLFAAGVAGVEKFRVDAEGDVFSKSSINVDGGGPLVRLRDAAGTNTLTQIYANDAVDFTYLYDYQNGRYVTYSHPDGVGIGTSTLDSDFAVTMPGLRVSSGNLGLNGRIYMDYDGPEQSQSIYFYNNSSASAEHLSWDETQNRFELSDALAIARVDAGSTVLTPVSYNRFGTGTAESASVGDANDAYFTDAVEIDGSLYTGNWTYLNYDGPDGFSGLFFYHGGATGQALYWDNVSHLFEFNDDLRVTGNLSVWGTKNFVQNHPYDPDLSVFYTALEGDEAGTYTRGSARLEKGEARVPLGETFAWVTNPEIGLTAHVTSRSPDGVLYVESVSTRELVVRNVSGTPDDAAFDYTVHGLRIGFEKFQPVQPRTTQARVPSAAYYDRLHDEHPGLQRHTAAARFAAMPPTGAPVTQDGSSAARTLRESIGEYDPDFDDPNPEARLAAMEAEGARRERAPQPEPSPTNGRGAVEQRFDAPISRVAGFDPPVREDGNLEAPELYPTMPVSEAVEPGDLLVLDRQHPGLLRRADLAADPDVVGIVVGEAVAAGDELHAPLALYGLATVKADASYGAILAGDLLASSPTPGHAGLALAPSPGTVIGKALESLETGTGLIKVLVMPR